jgi:hypothetical protein
MVDVEDHDRLFPHRKERAVIAGANTVDGIVSIPYPVNQLTPWRTRIPREVINLIDDLPLALLRRSL